MEAATKKNGGKSGGTETRKPSSGAMIGSYKGNPTISLPINDNGKMFTFGKAKAKAIVKHLDDIKAFAAE